MAIGNSRRTLKTYLEPTEELDHKKMTASRGRRWAVASLVCAALARAGAPFLFGLLGVATTGALVISLYVAGRLVTHKPPAGPFRRSASGLARAGSTTPSVPTRRTIAAMVLQSPLP